MKTDDPICRIALLALVAAGCTTETSPICGSGHEVAIDDESYCVYRSSVVVENGFMCPAEHPNLIEEGGIGVCSPHEMIPGGTLERIGAEYREVNPEFEGCILDFECDAGEVCRPGGCTVLNMTNNPTNNPTNNTTGSTNGGVECESSGDCDAGQVCEDGVCLGACGGFAGFECDATQWCDYPDDTICGQSDFLGTCRPRPEACDDVLDPVCGCDGVDYSNSCDANAGGTDIASEGTCG